MSDSSYYHPPYTGPAAGDPMFGGQDRGYSGGDMLGAVVIAITVAFVVGVLLDHFVFAKKGGVWPSRACVSNPKAVRGSEVKVADKGVVQFCGAVEGFELCDISGDSYVVTCAGDAKLKTNSEGIYTCDSKTKTKADWLSDSAKTVCYNVVPDPPPKPKDDDAAKKKKKADEEAAAKKKKADEEAAAKKKAEDDATKKAGASMSGLMNIWRARHMAM